MVGRYDPQVEWAIRDAGVGDLSSLNDVYRRSALWNDGDRALLLAHPEVLELTAASVAKGRTRAAAVKERIGVTGNDHALGFYQQAGFVTIGLVDTPLGVAAARLRRDTSG